MNITKSSRILLTGGAGYIGSIVTRQLLHNHHTVRVFDNLSQGGKSLTGFFIHPEFEFVRGDIRKKEEVKAAMEGMDQVIHLAAIVGDPACKKFKSDAETINVNGSEILLDAAANAGLKKFIFASTCSNYGLMKNYPGPLDENAPLSPQSEYAKQKTGFEKVLLAQKRIKSVILRFATAFGISPRMRFDLSVNHFTRDLAIGKTLEITSAKTWRPYCHVEDLAHAVLLAVNADHSSEISPVFNVGSSKENYSKEMLIKEIMRQIPDGKIKLLEDAGTDIRNYIVDFSRIRLELGFKNQFTVPDGISEVIRLVNSNLIPDLYSPEFENA